MDISEEVVVKRIKMYPLLVDVLKEQVEWLTANGLQNKAMKLEASLHVIESGVL